MYPSHPVQSRCIFRSKNENTRGWFLSCQDEIVPGHGTRANQAKKNQETDFPRNVHVCSASANLSPWPTASDKHKNICPINGAVFMGARRTPVDLYHPVLNDRLHRCPFTPTPSTRHTPYLFYTSRSGWRRLTSGRACFLSSPLLIARVKGPLRSP